MKITITGIYQTKFGELWDQSLEDLIRESALGALKDAHTSLKHIDAIYIANKLSGWVGGQNHLGSVVAEILGVNLPIISVEAACASGGVAIHQAALAIESGRYHQVLVIGAEKMTDIDNSFVAEALMGAASGPERETGITFPGLYGLMARAYMHQYGLTREDLALVPVKSHHHASLNPLAHFPFPVTKEQVLASSLVADPLRLLDCSGVSDGAAALVLSAKNPKSQVSLIGSGMATDTISLMGRSTLTSIPATKLASQLAYQEAGVKPSDVNLAEVHDCFSIAEVIAMEDLGFSPIGEGISLVKDGQTQLGGTCPINTSGGLKGCGHPVGATGIKQAVEIVKQLRGQATGRQVKRAHVGLTHNVGGSGGTAVVNIFTK